MRSTIRTATLGALLVGGAIALGACGSSPTPTAAPVSAPTHTSTHAAPAQPVARKYTTDWLQTQLTTTPNTDGTTTLTAACVDSTVQPDGSGSYECFMTYSDKTSGTGEIDVTSAGRWHTKGTAAPTTTTDAPASFTADGLATHLTSADFNKGHQVTIAQATCTASSVDANGAGTYSCDYTLSTGAKAKGITVAVAADGTITLP